MNFNQLVESVQQPEVPKYFKPDKYGNINCDNNQLTSLEGAPQKAKGSFYCGNNKLTSLEGAPQEVKGYFDCSNNKLTSLEGAPQEVKGGFYCSNNQLTSLKGAPQKVKGSFYCSNNQLTSLEGAPQHVERDFQCHNNPDLPFLELARMDLGNKVKGDIYFQDNGISVDKTKCTRAYYDIVKHTNHEEQEEIGNI